MFPGISSALMSSTVLSAAHLGVLSQTVGRVNPGPSFERSPKPEPIAAPTGARIALAAGSRATGRAPAARCACPRKARYHLVQWPPERLAAVAGNPRPSATTTARSRDAPPDRRERGAAVALAEREAATDAVCGRAGVTAPAGSADVR